MKITNKEIVTNTRLKNIHKDIFNYLCSSEYSEGVSLEEIKSSLGRRASLLTVENIIKASPDFIFSENNSLVTLTNTVSVEYTFTGGNNSTVMLGINGNYVGGHNSNRHWVSRVPIINMGSGGLFEFDVNQNGNFRWDVEIHQVIGQSGRNWSPNPTVFSSNSSLPVQIYLS